MAIYVLDGQIIVDRRRQWATMGFGGIVLEIEQGGPTQHVQEGDVIVAHRFDEDDLTGLFSGETAIVDVAAYERTPITHSCGYIYTRGAALIQESETDFARQLLDFAQHFARTGERDWSRLERLPVPDALLAYRLFSVDPGKYSKQLSELRGQAALEARAIAKDPTLDASVIDDANQIRRILADGA